MALAGVASAPVSAAEVDEASVGAGPEAASDATGLADDAEAIAAAAGLYVQGDAATAAALVEAAAADEAGVIESLDSGGVPVGAGMTLEAGTAGAVLTGAAGVELGIAVADAANDSVAAVVDGVAVAREVLPATDVVTRAVDGGVQIVAVLADASASTSVDFELTLPEGARLSREWDGSVAVQAPTETIVYDAVDQARYEAEVAAIVGDAEGLAALTDEQRAAIDAVEEPAGEIQTVMETVASVGAPWAVDANGVALETSYALNGDTLTQVVTTDEDTAFPVVADPLLTYGWAIYWNMTGAQWKALAFSVGATIVGGVTVACLGAKMPASWAKIVGSVCTAVGVSTGFTALKNLIDDVRKWALVSTSCYQVALVRFKKTTASRYLLTRVDAKNCA
ncbi:hypothetical protein [Demequina gelatinilytica]|uniref:hypothetical protein n=1 Tax=Demequina gelatinilytica TaxID=1638980 RepID=UPI0012E0195C|nr:hypothetical protein [Demequina gelatinilytica]